MEYVHDIVYVKPQDTVKRKLFNGILTKREGHLIFTPMNPNYLDMQVIHMTEQAF
jgi:bacterioferritin (cytochrome b1)